MNDNAKKLLLETLFLGVKTRPGERKGVICMFVSLFLILMTTYFLKPAREILILTEGTAEIRSYAVAAQALLLIFLLPFYGKLSRKFSCSGFMRFITILFSVILILFYIVSLFGVPISVAFFVWLGVFSVIVAVQFWAFATDIFTREAGERLFVIIAFGGSTGAWAGAALSRVLVNYLSAHDLILLSSITLTMSMIPAIYAVRSLPPECLLNECTSIYETKTSFLACFQIVLTRRFLLLILAFIVIFNFINSTGEYLLSSTLESSFDAGVADGSITIDKALYIGKFYSSFFVAVNLAGAVIQFFLVSRFIRHAGFFWAFALAPLVVMLGYGSLLFVPTLFFLRLFKISENSLDYSILNTTRQMLYLPLSRQEKYEGRATVESFGQKFGDLLQAVIVFLGINVFHFVLREFILILFFLSLLNAFFAYLILRERNRLIN